MIERAVRWRRAAQWCALVVGLSVLVYSVVASVIGSREREIKAQDAKLGVTLSQQVGAVDNYFEQARMVDLLLAGNLAFAGFYQAAGTTRQKIDAAGAPLRRVNTALASLELLFPGRIGEACFIDSSGQEIARVVDGVAATPA